MSQIETEKREKFLNFINEKWTESKNCPICGHNDWSPAWYVIQTPPLRDSEDKGVYTFMIMGCNNCGFSRLFNAVKAGLERGKELKTDEVSSDE